MNTGPTLLEHTEAGDERLSSLESAVRFSKANNLLGVFIEGDILVNIRLTSNSMLLIPRFPRFPVSLFPSHKKSMRASLSEKHRIFTDLLGCNWMYCVVRDIGFVFF